MTIPKIIRSGTAILRLRTFPLLSKAILIAVSFFFSSLKFIQYLTTKFTTFTFHSSINSDLLNQVKYIILSCKKYTPRPGHTPPLAPHTFINHKRGAYLCKIHPSYLPPSPGCPPAWAGLLAVLCPPTERLLAASAGLCGRGHAHGVAGRPDAGGAGVLRWLPAAAGLRRSGCVAAGARDADRGSAGAAPARGSCTGRPLWQKAGDPARAAAMRTALVTGLALLLHNFPEGVLTFFAGTADPSLGLRTAAAIALHNIPEGLAVAVPFAYATRRRTAGCWPRSSPAWPSRSGRCWRGCSYVGSSRRAF